MKLKEAEILSNLKIIFQEVFDDSVIIDLNTKVSDIDDWDSLSNIRLILHIEKSLNLRFSAEEVANIKGVEDLVNLILIKKG